MATYRERIEIVLNELEDIERTIPIDRCTYELEVAIRALECFIQE